MMFTCGKYTTFEAEPIPLFMHGMRYMLAFREKPTSRELAILDDLLTKVADSGRVRGWHAAFCHPRFAYNSRGPETCCDEDDTVINVDIRLWRVAPNGPTDTTEKPDASVSFASDCHGCCGDEPPTFQEFGNG